MDRKSLTTKILGYKEAFDLETSELHLHINTHTHTQRHTDTLSQTVRDTKLVLREA